MAQELDCGLSFWRPRWLRGFATARSFLFVYGLLGTIQTMSFMYFTITLTTLERRFKIPSGTTGIVLSGNEISQILLSLVLSYFGGRRHRPRWIAGGGAVSAASCLILAAAHFLFGPGEEALQLTREYAMKHGGISGLYNVGNNNASSIIPALHALCSADNGTDDTLCPTADTPDIGSVLPLVLIFMSQFVLGIGTTMYYTLGVSYLDDSVPKNNTPMTLAWALTFRMVGLMLSYGLVTASLHMYIDPWRTPLIESTDPRWLGAWWFGWLVLGIGMLAASWLAALFPRVLPKGGVDEDYVIVTTKDQQQELRALQPSNGYAKSAEKNYEPDGGCVAVAPIADNEVSVRDFWFALKRLLRNKLLMYNYIANVFYLLGASAYMTYIAKYIEVQFNRDSASSTIISGPVTIIGLISGFLLSGWMIQRFRPAPRKLFMWGLIVGVAVIAGQVSNLFLTCSRDSMVGNAAALAALRTDCNANCSCANVAYSPVCDVGTGRTYFSACHAGCADWSDERKRYSSCACADLEHFEANTEDVLPQNVGHYDNPDDMYSEEDEDLSYEEYNDQVSVTTIRTSTTGRSNRQTTDRPPADGNNTMTPGACVAGCATAFLIYNLIACAINWLGASARIGNILLTFR